jgi:hypothetical protein
MGLEKVPLIGGFFDDSEDQARDIYDQILAQYQNIELPQQQWESYSPEEIAYMGDYSPEMAAYQTIQEDPRLLGQQEAYLKQLKALSEQGFSPEDAAVFDQAQRQSAQQARGAREATMANMAARGVGGSGMELVSKELANQQAAERARQSMMEQAAAGARQRALYTQAYGGELGSQRGQNFQTESANKGIINRFNELNTGIKNTAAARNLDTRQALAGTNTGARNQAQVYNQEGKRGMGRQQFTDQMNKLGLITGAMDDKARSYLAESESNRASRGGLGSAIGSGLGYAFGGKEGAKIGGGIGGGLGGW